jgi:hypothetical protein
MREGCYEVVLVDQDGHTLDEIVINDQSYAVAIPGKEYVVKIIVHKGLAGSGSYPAENLRVGLYVDGVDVQYWKRLDLSLISGHATSSSVHTIFHGYKKSNHDLRSFIFAKTLATSFPSSSLSSSDHINNSSFGTIKVVIYEAIQTEGVYQNVGGKYEVPGQHSVNVDGKFYKQPSVTTMAGRNITETEKFVPLLRWKNKSENPLTTMNLFYHTQEMIQFLKLFHTETAPAGGSVGLSNSRSLENKIGKRKYQDIVDLTDDSIAPIPPSLPFPLGYLTPSTSSSSSSTILTSVRSHTIPSSFHSSSSCSSSSFVSPSYTISSSECASDEVEVLTVVKKIPMFDLTAAQVDSDEA